MPKKIIVKVPEILKARGLDARDLIFGAKISPDTAYNWADPDKASELNRAHFNTLLGIAEWLDLAMSDILEIVDDDT